MRGRAVLVVLVVLLAGCGGAFTTERPVQDEGAAPTPSGQVPTATPGGGPSTDPAGPDTPATPTGTADPDATPTPRPAGRVAVSGLALSFDEERVYRDVVALHGGSYEAAPSVQLTVRREPSAARSSQVVSTTPFLRLWEFDADAVEATGVAGLAIQQRVFLYVGRLPSTADRKVVLAHEYTHVLQFEAGAFRQVSTGVREGEGNHRQMYVATIEGAASYAEARYAAQHLDREPRERNWTAVSADRSRLGAYLIAPYFFGERYVRGRVDSVRNLSTVYADPPTTTEQLIHGYAPGEEPARPLTVRARSTNGSEWAAREPRTRGELVVRLILEGRLPADRAARAAAGWGADRLVQYDGAGDDSGYAWVLRWDSPAEADEFAAAMTDYLDARGTKTQGRWRDDGTTFDVRRLGGETVVVLAGPGPFVGNASVDGGGANVTVTAGG